MMIRMRPCNDAVVIDDENASQLFYQRHLESFKFILIMGIHCTGKTTFVQSIRPRMDWTFSRWSREPIIKMMYEDREPEHSVYGDISNLESKIIPKCLEQDYNRVFVESWGTKKSTRKRYLNLAKNYASAVVVFDGPLDLILSRARGINKMNLPSAELEVFLEAQHIGCLWPTYAEGWDSIFYATTFGGQGAQYLSQHCYLEGT